MGRDGTGWVTADTDLAWLQCFLIPKGKEPNARALTKQWRDVEWNS